MSATAGAPRRLFVGLLPPPDAQAAISAARGRFFWPPGARLTPASKLHVTLHFLGHVAADLEHSLGEALLGIEVAAFEITLREPQVWRTGLVVWLPDPDPALLDLRERIARRMALVGLDAQRPWTPHLTLARDAGSAAPPEAMAPLSWTVREVALVWSRPDGRYETLRAFQ